ncbi:MAG TPA: M23 family metallopeptidase [Polyangia bacterium]|nr:M23 family metallopeptidase [Polyangia bacterium]
MRAEGRPRRLAAGILLALSAVAGVSGAEPPARTDEMLAARELILVNQVGFARGTTRWRARELYRFLQNPAAGDGRPLPAIDRARAVIAGLNALRRDRQEETALRDELGQARAERAAIARTASAADAAADEPAARPAFVSPVDGAVEAGFGPARDGASGVWLFRPGLRFHARPGEPVRAPEAGVVQRIADGDGDGGARSLVIAHAGGWISIIGGLAIEPGVAPGQALARGQLLGRAAARPRASDPAPESPPAPRLTWELSHHRAPIDPATVIRR